RMLRKKERERHQAWEIATRFWSEFDSMQPLPTYVNHLNKLDREGVGNYLMPSLSNAEKAQLDQAQKQWPNYLMTLVELADHHPLALWMPGEHGICWFKDLPNGLKAHLKLSPVAGETPPKNPFTSAEGKGTATFVRAVLDHNKNLQQGDQKQGPLPYEL